MKNKLKEQGVEQIEDATVLFTHNFKCPHCDKWMSVNMNKVEVKKCR